MIEPTALLSSIMSSLEYWVSLSVEGLQAWLLSVDLGSPDSLLLPQAILVATAGLVAIVMLTLWMRRRPNVSLEHGTLADFTRGPRRMGFFAIFTFVALFAGWSAIAPLASATVASGIVSPKEGRLEVKHLEGGIIRSVHVNEGQRVAQGDPLITLDDTVARAGQEELYHRYHYLVATRGRLLAELNGDMSISLPSEFSTLSLNDAQTHIAGQENLLNSRRQTLSLQEEAIDARLSQLNEQVTGYASVLKALDRQKFIIGKEIENVQSLYDKGLERLPRLLELERAFAEVDADLAMNRAKILETEQLKIETDVRRLSLREQFQERANRELVDAQRMLSEIKTQLPARDATLQRTTMTAPIAGRVLRIATNSENSVVRPGELIMEIVPDGGELTIEAKVRTTDIDRIYPGMEARVVLTAYKQRNMPYIFGTLTSISPDALVDERSGEAYYQAEVRVPENALAALPNVTLTPGMPTEVMLLDEERTLFAYLVGPVQASLGRSFLED